MGVGIWGLLGPGGLAAGALGDGFRCFLRVVVYGRVRKESGMGWESERLRRGIGIVGNQQSRNVNVVCTTTSELSR